MLKFIDTLVSLLAILAGLVLAGLVVLTFIDVVMRYFFSAPLRGRQDIVEMGMIVSVFLAAPYTWRVGGHISVDLYETLLFPKLEIIRQLFVKISVAGIFALIAWRAWIGAEDAELFNEATNMIAIPHKPFMLLIAGISTLHAILVLIECMVPTKSGGTSAAKTAGGNE
ncbi:MAG: hypothetical protein COA78_34590 [Blastopirellula sp.]|nr:MAG: hypothetical protein COA78_34590 [Blastopirellula sp.]